MGKVWIEAALNGAWGRALQPTIPISVEEIVADGIAAARAGAAIIHLRAYAAAPGRKKDDWEISARVIEGIRAKADAIVYPTVPIAGSTLSGEAKTPKERYAHLEEPARRKLVEWGTIDPGSVNFSRFQALARGEPG